MGSLLQSTVIMVDLWISQEPSGVSGRCNIFLPSRDEIYFLLLSDLGKVANQQHHTEVLLSCFRLNGETYGFYERILKR